MVSVVLSGPSKIPSVDALAGPGSAVVGIFVDDDFHSRRCKGCFVVVEGTIELCLGRQARVDSRGS
jgi:hypothetical protein